MTVARLQSFFRNEKFINTIKNRLNHGNIFPEGVVAGRNHIP